MDTRFWGPSGWRLLHLIVSAPINERKEADINGFFDLLPYILPCKFCRHSLASYYEKRPLPKKYSEMERWLYEIHNDVNGKLRSQKLISTQNPSFEEIHKRYQQWANAPCASTQFLGWDFLYSIANTTPCEKSKSSPMVNAPPQLITPEARNKWNTMKYTERLPYLRKWWNLFGKILPYEGWRKAWSKSIEPPLEGGKKPMLNWLYKTEKVVCQTMAEQSIHNSFGGLCKEISAFSSNCSSDKSPRAKTCRAKKQITRDRIRSLRANK